VQSSVTPIGRQNGKQKDGLSGPFFYFCEMPELTETPLRQAT